MSGRDALLRGEGETQQTPMWWGLEVPTNREPSNCRFWWGRRTLGAYRPGHGAWDTERSASGVSPRPRVIRLKEAGAERQKPVPMKKFFTAKHEREFFPLHPRPLSSHEEGIWTLDSDLCQILFADYRQSLYRIRGKGWRTKHKSLQQSCPLLDEAEASVN